MPRNQKPLSPPESAIARLPCCPVCGSDTRRDLLPDIWRCPSCGYFGSTFRIAINQNSEALDESRRIEALRAVRQDNFEIILDRVQSTEGFPGHANALEVGCGHGWFLEALERRGHRAVGIEPDAQIAAIARRAGHDVTVGYFPEALDQNARYDAIFFNDVFEHLPAIDTVVESLKRHLVDRGWVVINLPVSEGVFFRIARLLIRFGATGPYRRLWQMNMPSPHLSYFSSENLRQLFAHHELELVLVGTLRSIGTKGLLDRIRYDRAISPWLGYVYHLGALALIPVLKLVPADIKFFQFRKLPGQSCT